MSLAGLQTPQKAFPGAFLNTPAPNKTASSRALQPFNPQSGQAPQDNSQNTVQQSQASAQAYTAGNGANTGAPKGLSLIERAARTLNSTFEEEGRYPALDNYISQGSSSDYDVPSSVAFAPFQKIKVYDIPDKIFEQYNQAQVSTMMGLFAEINHAWITIDNALYLWDYTHPNPELIGFEEQPNSITAVKLVTPRPGVFVAAISRLLVVATTTDIILIGVACQDTSSGATQVSLYQTRMQVSIKGISVQCIEGSAKTGRIFFAGRNDNDVYELTYQQEEKWFQNKCGKINHTSKSFTSVLPTLPFTTKPPHEFVTQMVVDDTRNLLYTLSSRSTIKIFSFRTVNTMDLAITRTISSVLNDLGHKIGQSSLLATDTSIVSISPISAKEASRLNLVATTSQGCRIFFSAVSGNYFGNDTSAAPTSVQVHHVKFPPKDSLGGQPAQQITSSQPNTAQGNPASDVSKALTPSRLAERFAPGYFLCFVQTTGQELLFMSAPDAGRVARSQDPAQANNANKFPEYGLWLPLGSHAEDVGLVTPPFGASTNPQGFGNELAVQFDQPVSEIAVLTNTGVHTFRRRRLVDVFAAAIRYGGGDEGVDGEIKNFVRMYGRREVVATALGVVCGQGSDVTSDARVAKVTDPDILDYARKAFIEHGGKPELNENALIDQGAPAVDNVRPSPRHEGLAVYIARLLRSVWKAPIAVEVANLTGGFQVLPDVALTKLQTVQRDLTRLQEFLNTNKSFIEGLAGPEALGRVSTKQEEVALQAEHRALNSLVRLISDVIEGISFVLVLFDERVDEIVLSITPESRQELKQTTYERLFCTAEGKELAKELVKAIVNRNIAQGSNVDTVTDALRRRCGSFCSADDCTIFKAQEQLKRASDTNASSESSRNLLNESLRLLQKVAASLSQEQLRWAVSQYASLDFCAGAIQLCLTVAQESDRGNRALSWVNEGSPGADNRASIYETRKKCYDLIHEIIQAIDKTSAQSPEMIDGQYTTMAKRQREAYDIINNSTDELFQNNLFDWYLSQGWHDRLLDIRSSFVVKYLQKKSFEDADHADLLCKYYAQYHNFLEAAQVQMHLAKSEFSIGLESRIGYLSQARANASTKTIGMTEMGRSRQSRQELIREISDLLDIANIQGDIIQRVKSDDRITPERKLGVLKHLDGQILTIDELYNGYADQASYYDLCLLIYQCADYRSTADIRATWQNLLSALHAETVAKGEPLPYEAVSEKIRELGARLHMSEGIFPISILLPMLERYSFEFQRTVGPPTWVVDIFLDLGAPFETLVATLDAMFYNDEIPFKGRNRHYISSDILHVIQRWYSECAQQGAKTLFGGDDNAAAISHTLEVLQSQGEMSEDRVEEARVLREKIEVVLR